MAKPSYKEGQPSLFQPQVTWRAKNASEWPDYTGASILGFDTEARNPDLQTKGCGGVRGDGHLAGISLSSPEHGDLYLPIGHAGGGNVDPAAALRYVRKQLGTTVPKAGANVLFDLEWLAVNDVEVKGPIHDILIADALIDETQHGFDLDTVMKRRLGYGKNEKLLKDAADGWGVHHKAGLWQMPAGYVGPYAETDASGPWKVWNIQRPLLEEEELMDVFDLETRMIPCLMKMRFNGVPFDSSKADALKTRLLHDELIQITEMKRILGGNINFEITQARSMGRCYESLGIPFERTPKSLDPSFKDEWLQLQTDPFSKAFSLAKHLRKARATLTDYQTNFMTSKERIHPTFASVKGEIGGADTGRFSCKAPNLQAVPAREHKYGPEIRSCFVAEKGALWGAPDYSQQEPRVTVHYAYLTRGSRGKKYPDGLPGALQARQRFLDDPSTDYHQLIADMAGIKRSPAKTLNLGCAYGQGYFSIMQKLNLPEEQAKWIYESYHREVPYVKLLGESCGDAAQVRGYMKTLFGRKRHFNLWEPDERGRSKHTALPFELAIAKWPELKLRRAFTHKALNSAVQGSSADMIKKAMVDIHEAGLGCLHTTIHDELGLSFTSMKEFGQVVDLMLNCIKLQVPLKVDAEYGPSWGEATMKLAA